MNKKTVLILLLVIVFVGGFLRIFPVEYASMRIYDTQLVGQSFQLGEGIFKGDFSIFKIPAKYPYFFSYLLLFFYGIFFLFGKIIGLFSSAQDFTNYVFLHLNGFYDFARILVGFFGMLLIPLVYLLTHKIVSFKNKNLAGIAGLLAAFLIAFDLTHVQFSHQERPHILLSFLVFLSFYFFVLFLEKKKMIHFFLFSLSVGITTGSLQVGLISLLFFALLIIFSKFKILLSYKFWAGVAVFLLIFIISYPYLIFSFKQTVSGGDFTLSGQKHLTGGFSNFSGQGFKVIMAGSLFYNPALILVFILFFLVFIFNRNKDREEKSEIFSKAIIGAIVFILFYVLIFGLYNSTYFRFLSPVNPFLCFLAGVLFAEIFPKFNKKSIKIIFIVILSLLLSFELVQAFRFNYLTFKKETKDLAIDWIEKNIPKSDLIALEGDEITIIPDKKSLQIQSVLDPNSLSQKDKVLILLPDGLYPKNSRAILKYWAFNYKGEKGYEFLKNQKVKYFMVFRPSPKESSKSGFEQEIISKGGFMVKSFSPFKENSLSFSDFPGEFKNPILDLWAMERMGPIVEIYKVQ